MRRTKVLPNGIEQLAAYFSAIEIKVVKIPAQ